MKKSRTIEVRMYSASGMVVEIRDTSRDRIKLYGGLFKNPITPASALRLDRLVNKQCVVAPTTTIYGYHNTNDFGNGLEVAYRYLPDINFDKDAKAIDLGAVNPVAILNALRDLTYYRVVIQKQGYSSLYADPAYILMMNQLASISGMREIDFDVYQKAHKEIESE